MRFSGVDKGEKNILGRGEDLCKASEAGSSMYVPRTTITSSTLLER